MPRISQHANVPLLRRSGQFEGTRVARVAIEAPMDGSPARSDRADADLRSALLDREASTQYPCATSLQDVQRRMSDLEGPRNASISDDPEPVRSARRVRPSPDCSVGYEDGDGFRVHAGTAAVAVLLARRPCGLDDRRHATRRNVVWLCKYNGSVWPGTVSTLSRTQSETPR